jgi:hypothetical protein
LGAFDRSLRVRGSSLGLQGGGNGGGVNAGPTEQEVVLLVALSDIHPLETLDGLLLGSPGGALLGQKCLLLGLFQSLAAHLLQSSAFFDITNAGGLDLQHVRLCVDWRGCENVCEVEAFEMNVPCHDLWTLSDPPPMLSSTARNRTKRLYC